MALSQESLPIVSMRTVSLTVCTSSGTTITNEIEDNISPKTVSLTACTSTGRSTASTISDRSTPIHTTLLLSSDKGPLCINISDGPTLQNSKDKESRKEKENSDNFSWFARCHRQSIVPRIPRATLIRKTLIAKAQGILDRVNYHFSSGDVYLDKVYGRKLTLKEAQDTIKSYMEGAGLSGKKVTVQWRSNICCSASMSSNTRNGSRTNGARHTLTINSDPLENSFLREHAIISLADHELGTHYVRSRNDAFQVWNSRRAMYGLNRCRSYQMLTTEEGLATLNTHLSLSCRYLWWPALLYFACYMSQIQEAPQLYNLLSRYLTDTKLRAKIVFRAKRKLRFQKKASRSTECCGWDQCYLTGASRLLSKLESINFPLLYSGKLAQGDLERAKHIARTSLAEMPHFLTGHDSLALYKKSLKEMYIANNFD